MAIHSPGGLGIFCLFVLRRVSRKAIFSELSGRTEAPFIIE